MTKNLKDRAYIIADAHLGLSFPGGEGREKILDSFLDGISRRARWLVIAGDFFDFWIEYRRAIRADYFGILHRLRSLVDAGVEVHFFAGNHDFGADGFLRKLGLQVYPGRALLEIAGARVLVEHGDGVLRRDRFGRLFRRAAHNPLCRAAYRLLHPDLGVALAEWVSTLSRKRGEFNVTAGQLEEYRRAARSRLGPGCEIVIFGHTHRPDLVSYPEGVYCNPGGWLSGYSYALLESGRISLWRHLPGREDEELK